jgi:phosphohistidine phosphatase SixA
MRRRLISVLCGLSTVCFAGGTAAQQDEIWKALAAGGKVIILRHADAPGPTQGREGDPAGFRLDDCSTQRNLSGLGRSQAMTLGNWLRTHNVVVSKVMASPWCRAKETAELMQLGVPVQVSSLLFNLGERASGSEEAVKEMPLITTAVLGLHAIIKSWSGPGNLLMVSHGRMVVAQVWGDNRHSPEQASMIVLQPLPQTPRGTKPFRVIGSLAPPN